MDSPKKQQQAQNESENVIEQKMQEKEYEQQENNMQQYDVQQEYEQQCLYMRYEVQQAKMIQIKQTSQNSQLELKDLIVHINKEVQRIDLMTCLGFDWSMMLYSCCQWDENLCNELTFSSDQAHKKKISYSHDFIQTQGWSDVKQCQACCEPQLLLRNICGHEFCEYCWTCYLKTTVQNPQLNPFPSCMKIECQARMSYTLCQILASNTASLKQKFIESLCRNYAMNNKAVKVCKGRPGFNCTKCFSIRKMLDIIECQGCGNMVCPRCGERSHGVSQCTNLMRWKKLGQTTMGLVQYYNYQKCPTCGHGVQRYSGCNQIICRCKVQFCYICGQKWAPQHSSTNNQVHDYCPNIKKIMPKYRQIKMRKKHNIIQFCFRIQDKRSELLSLDQIFQQIQNLRQSKSVIIQLFLKHFYFHVRQLQKIQTYSTFCKKVICIIWGQTMNDYFGKNQRSDFFCKMIREEMAKVRDFLFNYILHMYKLLDKPPSQLTEEQELQVSKEAKQKFYEDYFPKMKNLDDVILRIMKIVRQEFYCTILEQK